jgi:hypothetical protein
MLRIALFSFVFSGCGADREVVSNPVDSGVEEGIKADTAVVTDDGVVDELVVEPKNRTLTFVPGAAAQTVEYVVMRDTTDVTKTATFSIDDPMVGTFAANVLTNVHPGFTGVGKTFIVTARESGKRGRAKLTLVRLGDKDFLFSSPNGVAPTPDKGLFKVLDDVGAEVSVVSKNDPSNPPGVDARKLVTIRAMGEGWPKIEPPSCDPVMAKDTDGDSVTDTFVAGTAGRALCFDVRPITNVVVTAAETASFHRVIVEIKTSTGKILESRSVVVMVPPTDPTPR